MEGFSIREYASRMRSENVIACWPFDDTTNEETVKSLLPSITVKKFSWWLDEHEYMHSESGKNVDWSEKKNENVLEKGETSLIKEAQGVEESDIDAEQGMEMVRLKSSQVEGKVPKKRSIVEIFAVAPPIERFSSEEEEDSVRDEDGSVSFNYFHWEINWGLTGKRNEKKMKEKKTDNILKKAKRVIEKIEKKKADKADGKMDLSVPIKEN